MHECKTIFIPPPSREVYIVAGKLETTETLNVHNPRKG